MHNIDSSKSFMKKFKFTIMTRFIVLNKNCIVITHSYYHNKKFKFP
jgi:hypothetical protein